MFKFLPLAGMLLLAACVDQTAETPIDQDADGTPIKQLCGAADLQDLVGQPATVLETMKFAGPVRFLTPGTVMTMDLRQERLNISSDKTGVITQVYCG